MRILILVSVLAVCVAEGPKDDVQLMNIKSVKGGGSYQYRGDQNFNRFFNSTQHGYAQVNHTTVNHEVGVCYIEVPTATLVRDPKHIPAGNGSRPDLSRIRTCCAGYIRNIHNFHICDPVCTNECVNALCTAPETCTCFPDHVKNLGGFCVATCPIGCQNGHCSGGECLCKEGFKLDFNGRFCVPHCRDNCGGIGNCTAPNTCACKPGYASTPDGSCRPGSPGSYPPPNTPGSYPQPGSTGYPQPNAASSQPCGSCFNGYCVGTECRCRPGYLIYKGECKALCMPNCGPNTECVSPNVCAPKLGPGLNGTQPQSNNSYPSNSQYYPHPTQNTTYQNPNQYPYGQHPQNQNQYPYPNGQNPQYPGNPHNSTNPNNPYPINQYPGSHPGIGEPHPDLHNQYPGQSNRYPYSNQPNGTNQGQYPQQPGHQHLYPDLPSNNYPYPQGNYARPNGTDGQVYYQNRPYNPLENATYNLQQGGSEQTTSQNGTQGQYYGGGQYSHGQSSQGQFAQGQFGQGQYSHGQHSQGQYGQGQYGQGQHNQGQYGQGQYGQGQNNQGQYGQGQYGQGQYGQGQNNQGQYGQGQYDQGQYGQGQFSQGQNNQGHYGQGEYSQGQYGRYDPYGQPLATGFDQTTNECLPGYIRDPADSTRCIPFCPGGCLNGFCSAPRNCVCNEGYHKDFSVKGRSSCIKRERRSVKEEPKDIADLLVFDIADY